MNTGRAVRWEAPGLSVVAVAEPEPPETAPMPTVAEIRAIEQAAREEGQRGGYEDGFAKGHADGVSAGQAEVRRVVAQIEGVLDSFTRPLARLDGEVADALGELAVRVAGSMLGRAYVADATLLADLVREALDTIGSTTREVELRLHPDDIGALAPYLAGLSGVRILDDTTLARGDLRLHSENVRIDGTLSARLQACMESLAGGSGARP